MNQLIEAAVVAWLDCQTAALERARRLLEEQQEKTPARPRVLEFGSCRYVHPNQAGEQAA